MYGKGPHGCPRGFKWCDKKEECIPEGTEAKDKLKIEYQRYFFKEDKKMDNVDKLVDEVFDGGFHTFGKVRKAERKIDRLLDGDMSISGRPYDHPIKMKVVTTIDGKAEINVDDNVAAQVEGEELEECMGPAMNEKGGFEDSEFDEGPAKEDDPKKLSNDINTVPNQNVAGLLKSVHAELSESTIWQMVAEMRKDSRYKRFFTSMMEANNITSIQDATPEFVDAVNKAWMTASEQMMKRGPSSGWKHPMRRGSGGGSAYGAQAGGAGRKGGFGMIQGRKEQDEEEDVDGVEADVEERFTRPAPTTKGGFGSIKGTSTKGGFGSIKGRPIKREEEDESEDVSESVKKKLLAIKEAEAVEGDVTLNTIIMKYGIRASKMYNTCMTKNRINPMFSKNRRLGKAICRYNDYMYNIKQLKAHIGMCAQAKNPAKCKKHVMQAIKFDTTVADRTAKTIKKLKAKMKK